MIAGYDPSRDVSLNLLDLACMPFAVAGIVGFLVLPWHVHRLAWLRLRWGGPGMSWAFGGIAVGLVFLAIGFVPPWASQCILSGALFVGCETYSLVRAWLDRPRPPRRRRLAALARRAVATLATVRPVPVRVGR